MQCWEKYCVPIVDKAVNGAGVNINASCMLIPLGVVLYCSLGGLKACLCGSASPRPDLVEAWFPALYYLLCGTVRAEGNSAANIYKQGNGAHKCTARATKHIAAPMARWHDRVTAR